MKTYAGITINGEELVLVQQPGKQIEHLEHHVRHSPDGFNWGYIGSGPAELARCILLDLYDEATTDRVYHELMRTVISKFKQGETWELREEQVREFVETALR